MEKTSRKRPRIEEEGTSSIDNAPVFDISDGAQMMFVSDLILNNDKSERIIYYLRCANLKLDDVFSVAIAMATAEHGLTLDEKASKVSKLIAKKSHIDEMQRNEEQQKEYAMLAKQNFLKKFYFCANLDKHKKKGDGILGAGWEIDKTLESYKYIKSNPKLLSIQKTLSGRVTCKVCKKCYPKYHGKGTIEICIPCINKYTDYKLEEEREKMRNETMGDVRDFMEMVRLYFDDPLPEKQTKES